MKKSKRAIADRSFNYTECEKYTSQRCLFCKSKKYPTVMYRQRNTLWKKTLVALCFCESCLDTYMGQINELEDSPNKEALRNALTIMKEKFQS
jgi:hypothetical protein